jgi:hypothetical protein
MSKHLKLIEEFQCPGCVVGSDTTCGKFEERDSSCVNHVAGTMLLGAGSFLLGMPKGFCKTGLAYDRSTGKLESANKANVAFYNADEHEVAGDFWNNCNVPVWAMEKDDHLFVRVFMPRINFSCTQVIDGGTIQMIRDKGFNPLDVREFYEEID